ncbi:hypothetical protein C7H19_19600 [Aphanothece hegewaldii CCALA 016]|uniref:Uncharacterized protein n=1 Tax=Aphanothece hegewaldii CCALA 016 TaxID=2107694 RepID=A0A2T1LTI2_9CHRO|nr:hypothetical protein [Aphanothece hegewaldii]PSF33926.1 hypothetical protein C7H19_19600 [Aphanothece hegewaldii CCALA 016]
MIDEYDPLILFDSSLSWQDWETWGMLLLLIAFAVTAYIYVDQQLKPDNPTHRYNRETGKVEKNTSLKKDERHSRY